MVHLIFLISWRVCARACACVCHRADGHCGFANARGATPWGQRAGVRHRQGPGRDGGQAHGRPAGHCRRCLHRDFELVIGNYGLDSTTASKLPGLLPEDSRPPPVTCVHQVFEVGESSAIRAIRFRPPRPPVSAANGDVPLTPYDRALAFAFSLLAKDEIYLHHTRSFVANQESTTDADGQLHEQFVMITDARILVWPSVELNPSHYSATLVADLQGLKILPVRRRPGTLTEQPASRP
eukprot:COSAG01_NODE_569_length_15354_cov_17.667584_2_plen_238_part_00